MERNLNKKDSTENCIRISKNEFQSLTKSLTISLIMQQLQLKEKLAAKQFGRQHEQTIYHNIK